VSEVKVTQLAEGALLTTDVAAGTCVLRLSGQPYQDLRRAVDRALNTDERPAAWLFELSNAMDANPIPPIFNARNTEQT
jgi:hypothetical protein